MTERLNRRDMLFFGLMIVGYAAAIFHMVDNRIMNGVLVALAMTAGVVIRFLTIRDRPAGGGPDSPRDRQTGTAAERRNRWSDEEPVDRDTWLRSGIIAGFLATIVMSGVMVIGYFSSGIFAQEDGNQIGQWFYGLTHNELTDNAFDIPLGAYSLNLLAGIIWALAYAGYVEPRLRGPGWRKGMIFSILPWILSLVVFFPIVGAGFLGLGLDAGPLPIIGNLILHLVYGGSLGAVYAIPSSAGVGLDPAKQRAARWEDRGLAVGLMSGLIIGLAGGAVLGLIFTGDLFESGEFLLAGAAAGVMAGAVLGPIVALDRSSKPASSSPEVPTSQPPR
ncbi:MAG: DUF6789 family protein [Chloroflexota bacterium]